MLYPGEFAMFAGPIGGELRLVLPWQANDLTYASGCISLESIAARDPAFGLSAMYIEFENVAAPEDAASIPDVDPADLTYFADLVSSPTRDYLRVQITEAPHRFVVSGYENILPSGQYNGAILYATSAGAVGVHGKEFSAGANSKVCGLGIVAAPDFTDRTQDILYARTYYAADKQWAVQDGNQVRVPYRLKFTQI